MYTRNKRVDTEEVPLLVGILFSIGVGAACALVVSRIIWLGSYLADLIPGR